MKIYLYKHPNVGFNHLLIRFDEDPYLHHIISWPIYHCDSIKKCYDLSQYWLISNQETTNLIYESLINMSNSFDNGQYYELSGYIVQLYKDSHSLPRLRYELSQDNGNDASKLVKLSTILNNIISSVYENISNEQ